MEQKLISYQITDKQDGSFVGDDGERKEWFWYKADEIETGINYRFGSRNGEYEIGDTVDLNLVKTPGKKKGSSWYKDQTN